MAGDFKIGGPGPGRPTSGYTNSEHIPHLVAYCNPVEEERTGADKKTYTVAKCSAVVCITEKKAFEDVDVSGKVLAPRLFTSGNEVVAVRLIEGEAKAGQNAPIIPQDPIPVELEEVQEVFSKYAVRMPTGKVIFDVDTFNKDHASSDEAPFT